MADPRITGLRRTLGAHADAATLAALDALDADLSAAKDAEARLAQLNESLFAVASLDFSKVPQIRQDGSAHDAAAGCVAMLGEELRARLDESARTEQRLEERVRERTSQLEQASKLAGVGQLAAGIAHEINNPLAVILGFAQGIERRAAELAPQLAMPIASIVRESLRCKRLVEQLLTFSRTGAKKAHERLELHKVVSSVAPLLQGRAITQGTTLQFDVGEDLAPVLGNATQLEQVLINLGNNALDAVEHGGHVTFKARAAGPEHLTLEVIDDGPGMAPELRARIFEPFFTTKEVGRGTGLGLSLSYEIVRQHGGTLQVSSALGAGTTMAVQLPNLLFTGRPGTPARAP